jgi:peptidyl-prolyl cis-trans isomerase D
MEGVRSMPDSAKVRHILVSTQTRDSATAYKLIDSLRTAINSGSNFDSLCAKFSEDPGSKDKGGVYDNVPSGQMVPPFNDYIFLNSVGSKGIVKTDFGYHYIEILGQKGSGAGYKVAYLPKEIAASQTTDDLANENANKFASDIKDIKTFDAAFEKDWKNKGYQKGVGPNIQRTAADIPGVGSSRNFVRNVYEAKLGEVLKPERVGESYVVAVVTEINKEGSMSVATARPRIESLLRNKKKAEILKQKVGKVNSLEEAITKFGGNKTIEVADSVRINGSSNNPSLGFEPRVVGAAFNPSNKGKVIGEALEGANGVFVIRVEDVLATPSAEGNVQDVRKQRIDQAKQMLQGQQYPMGVLRTAATIKDKRADRY